MRLFWHYSINFGDLLSVYLLSKFTGVDIDDIKYANHNDYLHKYIITGSILSIDNISNATIFGAGFAFYNNYFTAQDTVIKGVRGNMSFTKIKEELESNIGNKNVTIDPDVVIGEPSLCLPHFFPCLNTQEFELGLIPHIVDYERCVAMYGMEKGVCVIDLRQALNESIRQCVERVCTEISRCKKTASSSLHGMITSVAYGIPTEWLKFSTKIIGDDFKFHDFIDSVDFVSYAYPVHVDLNYPIELMHKYHRGVLNCKIDVNAILQAGKEII